ncbi:MAG: four-helix bundle copper-binding protein [Pseudomonadota bacterium]
MPNVENPIVLDCIENCSSCHETCTYAALNHCLPMGGKHAEPEHFKLMLECAKICETSAYFLLSDSSFRTEVCDLCADICEACAESCADLSGMEDCVTACNLCADSCRALVDSNMAEMSLKSSLAME